MERIGDAGDAATRPAYDVIRQTCPPSSLARRAPLSPSPGTNPHVSQRHTSRFTTPPQLGAFLAHPDLERTTWCDQPDLQELHQTFIRPLSFSWTDGVWPVFSNSKLAGFADVLVPAWYTWYDRMPYDEAKDVEWKGKANQLYWRGTNTGGRSVGLEWMGWTRSRLVSKVNRLIEWRHEDRVLVATADNRTLSATLPSSALNAALADVAFAAPDQHGDADSLESQSTEPSFRFTDGGHYVPFEHNYLFKAVLDLDGTAYSGRFPTLMRSRSAVVKSRLFTEALDDTLIPWYHYVPLSVRYTELYHVLAYFFGLAAVPAALYKVAERGRTWATECARRDDALVYVYLLVLEWARLCADDRESDAWNLVL
ncbi:glycosyltransferase family 90 protein [Rhodotorula graminis WP1]|uniref:Glycosyltransferase family 90 protein n=1 Tax=Rhodotorula graminis (strain WP1) TaxID=578459 RepID=A0A0P9EQ49_RHOGW|nr:glycosyltransferase family 90 protein [Rhodotorula graminis WP1]KPV71643.1 glycosyltransferase family 90 protein [Rhodotorula graminis WP1]